MKNLIFFDIDGTLVPEGENEISQDVINVIKQLNEQDENEVFICTGRCYHQAKKIIFSLGLTNYITSNGQEVQRGEKLIYNCNFSQEEASALIDYVEGKKCAWAYETRTNINIPEKPFGEKLKEILMSYGFKDIIISDNAIKEGIFQLWIFEQPEKIDGILAGIGKKNKFYKWSDECAEILPGNESKGNGIRKVVEFLKAQGTKEIKTFAFGDGVNDVEMFEYCDVAIVMGNAKDSVKKHADFITTSCEEDGIKKGLTKYNLI